MQYTRHRFRKNVPGPFYTTGDCLACDAPETEAPELLARLDDENCDTYFVRQPTTLAEIERACRALEVCCVAALRYDGTDPKIIRRLGNDPEYCDHLLPGGPVPRPDWMAERLMASGATNNDMHPTGVIKPDQMTDERKLVLDEEAESASAELPAFLSRPRGTPVYHGFPLVEETWTDGWCYGAITEFNEPECHPNGCESGDGYVQAPDGSRAGLVWSTGTFAALEVCALDEKSWGVYEIAFPKPVRNVHDLVECFRSVLPELQAIYARVRDEFQSV